MCQKLQTHFIITVFQPSMWLHCSVHSQHFSHNMMERIHTIHHLNQGCTNIVCQANQATKFCIVAPNICGSSAWNSLYFTLLAHEILRWLPVFWMIFEPALNTSPTNMSEVADTVHRHNTSVLLKLQALFIIKTFLLAIFHLSLSQKSV